ncbi:MAG: hypothetical protein Tsb0021_13700 [Chlamydiales bacterium]
MQLFDRRSTLLFLIVFVPLLFLPKFNLISFSEQTAGIRLDDILLFLMSILLVWAFGLLRTNMLKIEILMVAITLTGCLSYLINQFLNAFEWIDLKAHPLYAIRLFEYFIFFYIGIFAYRHLKMGFLIGSLILWIFMIMTLQHAGVLGAMTSSGYQHGYDRIFGIAAFPSEMGMILNLLFTYVIFSFADVKHQWSLVATINYLSGLFITFIIFLYFTLLTGNRISLLALTLCFVGRIAASWHSFHLYLKKILLIFSALIIGFALYFIATSEQFQNRSSALFSWKNVSGVQEAWQNIDLERSPIGQEQKTITEYDASWWMRVYKWVYVSKIYLNHPECYLLGIGPGTCFTALDGGLLRITVELGIVGFLLYATFFWHLAQIDIRLKWMLIVFVCNMLTFDVYLAYKPMSLIFFVGGYLYSRKGYFTEKPTILSKNAQLST